MSCSTAKQKENKEKIQMKKKLFPLITQQELKNFNNLHSYIVGIIFGFVLGVLTTLIMVIK